MTQQKDKSVPEAVDRVINQLNSDNTKGALQQIQEEMTKPGMKPESNKQFLSELTQRCQEQGYLPKLAVDFGKSKFNTLDLDSNGKLSSNELNKILNEPKLRDGLNPFQREMASYLIQNNKEIALAAEMGGAADVTPSMLNAYEKSQNSKYGDFVAGQHALNIIGNSKLFDVIDKDKDGFITKSEIDDQLDYTERRLAETDLKQETKAKLEDQMKGMSDIKERFSKYESAALDTRWSGYVSRQDIKSYAEQNQNPRTAEHIPAIDDRTVGSAPHTPGVNTSSKFTSDVMTKYFMEHAPEMDLNGNGKISQNELNKILENPEWRSNLSEDQRRVVEKMRTRFDAIAKDGEISHSSIAEWSRAQAQAREDERRSGDAAKYMNTNFKNLDKDKNNWLSASELDKQIDFVERALGSGTANNPAQSAKELETLQYIKAHKSEMSTANWGSDNRPTDFQDYANKKSGKLSDVFIPSEKPVTSIATQGAVDASQPSTTAQRPTEGQSGAQNHPTQRPTSPEEQRIENPQETNEEPPSMYGDGGVITDTRPSEATEVHSANDGRGKNSMDEYVAQYFKYNQNSYNEAMQEAAEKHKPIVIVAASRKDTKAIHAGAQAAAEGKAVVVFVDKDKLDPNSPLGKYTSEILKQHNREENTKDTSFIAVFDVKEENGAIKEGSHKQMLYGNSPSAKTQLRDYVKNTFDEPRQTMEGGWHTPYPNPYIRPNVLLPGYGSSPTTPWIEYQYKNMQTS